MLPELPEVETVRSGLSYILRDQPRIEKLSVRRRDLRRPIPAGTAKKLSGQKLKGVRRRAKYLLIDTESFTIVSHLGMTGSWRMEESSDPNLRKHDHLLIHLEGGQSLIFNDPRRFGLFLLSPIKQESKLDWFKNLGPEPLNKVDFNSEYLFAKSRKKQVAIKNFIMDQKVVVGVGNIYASEALYRAGIRPTIAASRLTKAKSVELVKSIQVILNKAIDSGGTTIKDFRQAGGSEGYFANELQVYGRAGELCYKCKDPIQSKVIGGRSTFWCRNCQS
jgi:formamidopyrimidine-DNA glycosylase